MKFISDNQRRAMFARLSGINMFSKNVHEYSVLRFVKEPRMDANSLFDFPVVIKKDHYGNTYVNVGEAQTLHDALESRHGFDDIKGKLDKSISDYTAKHGSNEVKLDNFDIERLVGSKVLMESTDPLVETVRKKREVSFSKAAGITETIDGYECDYCGSEFSSKTLAQIHSSVCDDKDLKDIEDEEDGGLAD
jgi:hypothetical protein